MNNTLTLRQLNKVQPNTKTYWSAHWWISDRYGRPELCENSKTSCRGVSSKYHWANLSGECKRIRSDWKRLCVSCHRLLDCENKCKRGHELAGTNLYIAPKTNQRGCRACRLMSAQKFYRRTKT